MRSESNVDRNSDAKRCILHLHLHQHLQLSKLVKILVLLLFIRRPKHPLTSATCSPHTTPALTAEYASPSPTQRLREGQEEEAQ